MVVLGLQAYLSDASNGMLASAFAAGGRRDVAAGKLAFGVQAAAAAGAACTLSTALACPALGAPSPGLSVGAMAQFWTASAFALVACLLLHFLLGLVTAAAIRGKAAAIGTGLMIPFLLLGLVKATLGAWSRKAATVWEWVAPTELATALGSWTPGGNTLVDAPATALWARALLLAAWLVAGAWFWIHTHRHRQFFPADQG